MCSLSESRIELVAYLNLRLEFKKLVLLKKFFSQILKITISYLFEENYSSSFDTVCNEKKIRKNTMYAYSR